MGEKFVYKVADGMSTSDTRRKVQKKHIQKHQPVRNKSKGGEGAKQRK